MAKLIQVVDEYSNEWLSSNGKERITLTRARFIMRSHWELVDTSHAEIMYFCSLMDNE